MLVGAAVDAQPLDVIVIGGGQAGLAAGYFLRRTKLRYRILDSAAGPGGAWGHTWDSLRLFSPARWSSLPGKLMDGGPDYYPHRNEVISYLANYESQYKLPVERPVKVESVLAEKDYLRVQTDKGSYLARFVISATGSWGSPKIPEIPGREQFGGVQLHSANYRTAGDFAGKRVAVVGGGNSGAQILAEVSELANCRWITERPPQFLPDELDGRAIFDIASAKYRGEKFQVSPASLGDVVVVPPVAEARARGAFDQPLPPPSELFAEGMRWADGSELKFDVIIWCTGFSADLQHLDSLKQQLKESAEGDIGLEHSGRLAVNDNQALGEPRLFLLGYGSWTGFASATLVGVGRTARSTVAKIKELAEVEHSAA